MVRTSAADFVRSQIAEAVAQGARAVIAPGEFPADQAGTPYLAPQVLTDVNHRMRVMPGEPFGPAVGVMAVDDDDEAVGGLNDTRAGPPASTWTSDVDAATRNGERRETR